VLFDDSSFCEDTTAAPAAAAAAGFTVVVVTVAAGTVAVVAGRVSVVTGSVWVLVTVTILAGSVSVTAGRVSVTVADGTAGASLVVSRVIVVFVSAPGVVVVAGRLRVGSDDVRSVESAPFPPPPQPAVAIATVTPSNPATTWPAPARACLAVTHESLSARSRPNIVLSG
jgi:hypothetical protein